MCVCVCVCVDFCVCVCVSGGAYLTRTSTEILASICFFTATWLAPLLWWFCRHFLDELMDKEFGDLVDVSICVHLNTCVCDCVCVFQTVGHMVKIIIRERFHYFSECLWAHVNCVRKSHLRYTLNPYSALLINQQLLTHSFLWGFLGKHGKLSKDVRLIDLRKWNVLTEMLWP